ncbi:DUF6538 domain-containing protein [Methylophilus sp. OH31]|uniref:DUF6538 domain-containing protein n=1 Tax=Methylophilus sp. OH31 TaxID=1387312 RepID=UPI00046420FF|nr:DUF6538 domain-containing protein [Methylophilus sp. OH31]
MKEPMCAHLAKRGSAYYYRRKTPVELVHLFGKEAMKSLGTKERKLAETLVRQIATEYDMLLLLLPQTLCLSLTHFTGRYTDHVKSKRIHW